MNTKHPKPDISMEPSAQTLIWCRDHTGRTYTFEEAQEAAADFHGYPAPGLILGLRMVALALERLPRGILFDAISETRSCLPDAVQLLTLCTVGNGWLKVLDLGRFALALFEKSKGRGIRVSIDAHELKSRPALHTWMFKLKPKHEQDTPSLVDELRSVGSRILKIETIQVARQHLGKVSKGTIATCSGCAEAYPLVQGDLCRACQGGTPYLSLD